MQYFCLLLQASLVGAIAIALFLLVRHLGKASLDRRIFVALWAILVFRLLMVDSFICPVSVAQFLPDRERIELLLTAGDRIKQAELAHSAPVAEEKTASALVVQATSESEAVQAAEHQEIPLAFIIWLVGATCILTTTALLHVLFRYRSRDVVCLEAFGYEDEIGKTKVFLNSQIATPMAIGIFRPQIHLPDHLDLRDKTMLRHILVHEQTHINRQDNFLKLLMLIALSLHWFNPFVWLLYKTLNKDLECCCDSATIKKLGEQHKAAYARTLLTMATQKSFASPAAFVFASFGSSFLKERIVNITKKGCPACLSWLLLCVFSLTFFAFFATDAQALPGSKGLASRAAFVEKADLPQQAVQEAAAPANKELLQVKNATGKTAEQAKAWPGKAERKQQLAGQGENELLSVQQAKALARKIAGNAVVVKCALDKDKTGLEYELTLTAQGVRYDLEIDAYSGELLTYNKKKIK